MAEYIQVVTTTTRKAEAQAIARAGRAAPGGLRPGVGPGDEHVLVGGQSRDEPRVAMLDQDPPRFL